MNREEIEELKGLAASLGLYDDKKPCKRAVILGKAIKALEQQPILDKYEADKEGEEASQSAKKSWTAEEIQKAADLLKERFLQNADFLFCSPEDEADIKKTVGYRFEVKGMAGIPQGRIYLVDRNEVEKWRPRLCSEQEETT